VKATDQGLDRDPNFVDLTGEWVGASLLVVNYVEPHNREGAHGGALWRCWDVDHRRDIYLSARRLRQVQRARDRELAQARSHAAPGTLVSA
jgi:hypothetical protein